MTIVPKKERLERLIAHDGLASRREAKDLIVRGKVTVNGVVITEPGYGMRVGVDHYDIAGISDSLKESYVVYKPLGIETTKTMPRTKDLHDYFPKLAHLSPVGRLDKDTEGMIILTNDGTLTKALTRSECTIGKTYLVSVRENIVDTNIQKMSRGILLDKIMTKPAIVSRKSRTALIITIYEGRKHQIRRMCAACHLTIVSLNRIAIGHLKSDGMKAGNVKKLSLDDVELLKR